MLAAISTNERAAAGGALAQGDVNTILKSMADSGAPFEQPVMFANAFQKQKLSSIYANHRFNDKLSAFVRLDNINRNSDGHEEDVTIMGLVLSPTKGLNIAPNIYTTDINGITEETFKLNFQFKF